MTRWGIDRVMSAEGLARPRQRHPNHESNGDPYPGLDDPEPGHVHPIDLVGPRQGAKHFTEDCVFQHG